MIYKIDTDQNDKRYLTTFFIRHIFAKDDFMNKSEIRFDWQGMESFLMDYDEVKNSVTNWLLLLHSNFAQN